MISWVHSPIWNSTVEALRKTYSQKACPATRQQVSSTSAILIFGSSLVSPTLEAVFSTLPGHHRRDARLLRVFLPIQVHIPVTGFRRSLPE
jgi:hypothetical protein